MKKIAILITILTFSFAAFAGGDQYNNAMKSTVAIMDTTTSPEGMQKLSNQFQRIANVEQKEWLPYYYGAYCLASSSFGIKDKNKIDDYLDIAESLAHKADSLNPNNSEIYALRSLICSGRIMVSPMSRGRKYGGMASEFNKKSVEADSLNPRPYLLKGQGLFYTPSMFGGGKDKAKPALETAMKKFATFKPTSEIAPHWGQSRAEKLLEECGK